MFAAFDQRSHVIALLTAALAAVLALSAVPAVASGQVAGAAAGTEGGSVVVQAGSADRAEAVVSSVGGEVDRRLEVIGGVSATVPDGAVDELRAMPRVEVAPDVEVEFHRGPGRPDHAGPPEHAGPPGHASGGDRDEPDSGSAPADAPTDSSVQIGAMQPPEHWTNASGAGVGVALLDTGVAETPDLEGRVIHGPDYSDEDDGVDRFGHGTFMAGLIAGDGTASVDAPAPIVGMAPGAHIVSVKLAGEDGATSLSKVLDAIGWVIENRDEHGIRVLNLSLGVPTERAPQADPLSQAVQAAWASGITVVAAAGNDGDGIVTSPGRDPWAITVGSTDTQGTVTRDDDEVADWSGAEKVTSNHKPEVLAPGDSTVSLRAPGSTIDEDHEDARVGDHYFRGSGTSMSAALVSGAAAVLLEHRPFAVPDDVKGALVEGGQPVPGARGVAVDLAAADALAGSDAWRQDHKISLPTQQGRLKQMPWSDREAPEATSTWERFYWADGDWERFYWAGDGWELESGLDWERFYWADGEWHRFYWAEDIWDRFYWADGDWQRFYWAGDGFESMDREDPRFARFYWARFYWAADAWDDRNAASADWHRANGTRVDFERFYWAGLDVSASAWQQGADWSHSAWGSVAPDS